MSKYPNYLAPDASGGQPSSRAGKSRGRREPSGVFSLFQPAQIQQFKEAFQLIDVDKDGYVTEKDLTEIYENLGIPARKQRTEELLSARPGRGAPSQESSGTKEKGINFTMFLAMMGERLIEFDAEQELLEAFGSFDENDSGTVNVAEMRRWLGEMGDRLSEEEVEAFLNGPYTSSSGELNYREWVKAIRINEV